MFAWQTDVIQFEDFKKLHPNLAEKLEPGQQIENEYYVYRRIRSGKRVYRQSKLNGGLAYYSTHGWTEKH